LSSPWSPKLGDGLGWRHLAENTIYQDAQVVRCSTNQYGILYIATCFVADDAVPVGQREFASGLLHRSLRPLALPPASRVAGCCAPRSAPLGVLRPKPLRGRAWSPIWRGFIFVDVLLAIKKCAGCSAPVLRPHSEQATSSNACICSTQPQPIDWVASSSDARSLFVTVNAITEGKETR
jgi:hypothetical protein